MKKFNELTKAQKRVVLAKDALKWLKSGLLEAQDGIIWSHFNTCQVESENSEIQSTLKKQIKNGTLNCQVCARGALLVSTVAKCNKFTLLDYSNAVGMFNPNGVTDRRLSSFFSQEQLALMEGAFEGDISGYAPASAFKKYDACVKFHSAYDNNHDRLVAILKNVIKNNGTFKVIDSRKTTKTKKNATKK